MKLNKEQIDLLEEAAKLLRKAQLASTTEVSASQDEYAAFDDLSYPIIDIWEEQTGKDFKAE